MASEFNRVILNQYFLRLDPIIYGFCLFIKLFLRPA